MISHIQKAKMNFLFATSPSSTQCMQLEYMQGILSLSWNDCYVLYLIIY